MKKTAALLLALLLTLSCACFAAADEVVTLTVMNVIASDDEFHSKMIEQFEAENPNIKIEHISTVNAELKKQVRIAMLAGGMPDIIAFDNPDYASFAASGYLMDITDMLKDWDDMPDYYPATLSAVSYKDRIYGLPFESNSLGLWYNKTILDELGLDVPTTWDDVLEICVAAKEKGYYGMSMAAPASEVGTFQFIPWLYAAGGSIEKLDTPEAVKAMTFLADLVKDGYMSKEVLGYSHGDLSKAFMSGNVALMVNGSWQIGTLKEVTTFEYGATTMPVLKEGDVPTTCLGGYHMGISADCEHPEEALKYLEFICSAEYNRDRNLISGLLPTNTDTAADPAFAEGQISMFVAGLPGAIARVNPFWPELSVNVYTALQAAISGEKTPEQALTDAQALNAAYWQL